jgi:hypothetical protein
MRFMLDHGGHRLLVHDCYGEPGDPPAAVGHLGEQRGAVADPDGGAANPAA